MSVYQPRIVSNIILHLFSFQVVVAEIQISVQGTHSWRIMGTTRVPTMYKGGMWKKTKVLLLSSKAAILVDLSPLWQPT